MGVAEARGDGSHFDMGYDEYIGTITEGEGEGEGSIEGEGETGTDIVYVNKANTSGTEDGLTWATAYVDLQRGIDDAYLLGKTQVWVAPG